VEFRTLRYFVHVAEARSFSKASVHLRVAQPALSRQIRKLEVEIGMPLFLRTSRHLELTEAGRLMLSRAHVLLRQVTNTLDEVRASSTNLSGALTIGVSPATSELVAPLLMRECAARYPLLRLGFVEGFSRMIFDQLINQELTLCLIHNPPPHKSIEIHPLLIEAMYLVGPPTRVGELKPVTPKTRLDGLPFILPNESHALRQLIERAAGQRLNTAVQTDGMITTLALVAAGHGYTILPYSAIHHQLTNRQVSAARLTGIDVPWTLSLACWSDQRAGRAVDVVLEILRNHFAKLADDNPWGRVAAVPPARTRAPRRRRSA
jgi:LysR family nitrogen assimilation transcriptional regulator